MHRPTAVKACGTVMRSSGAEREREPPPPQLDVGAKRAKSKEPEELFVVSYFNEGRVGLTRAFWQAKGEWAGLTCEVREKEGVRRVMDFNNKDVVGVGPWQSFRRGDLRAGTTHRSVKPPSWASELPGSRFHADLPVRSPLEFEIKVFDLPVAEVVAQRSMM